MQEQRSRRPFGSISEEEATRMQKALQNVTNQVQARQEVRTAHWWQLLLASGFRV